MYYIIICASRLKKKDKKKSYFVGGTALGLLGGALGGKAMHDVVRDYLENRHDIAHHLITENSDCDSVRSVVDKLNKNHRVLKKLASAAGILTGLGLAYTGGHAGAALDKYVTNL